MCSNQNLNMKVFDIGHFSNTKHNLQYNLWQSMLEKNLEKGEIEFVFRRYFPIDTMNQKTFFFDQLLDKPYPKVDKYGIPGTAEVQKIIYEN